MAAEVNDQALAVLEEAQEEMRRGGGDNYGVRLTVVESQQPASPKAEREDQPKRPNRDELLG